MFVVSDMFVVSFEVVDIRNWLLRITAFYRLRPRGCTFCEVPILPLVSLGLPQPRQPGPFQDTSFAGHKPWSSFKSLAVY